MSVFETKQNGKYASTRQFSADEVVAFAMEIVAQRFQRGACMSSPDATRQYLALQLAERDREIFGALFLDSQHRLICDEVLFKGSIDATAVYPRIVVQRALQLNAAALILYHNHPSGEPEPSVADRHITTQLTESLMFIDVRVIDHLVVAGTATVSFAERSWL